MSVQDLGSIAEFIGAVAVIVTLVYLAIQTRQARIAAEQSAKFAQMQATGSIAEAYSRWRGILISRPEIVAAITRANAGEDLTEVEKIQVGAAFEELFIACTFAYVSGRTSASIQSSSTDLDYLVDYLKKNPSAVDEWRRSNTLIKRISPEFITAVRGELDPLRSDA